MKATSITHFTPRALGSVSTASVILSRRSKRPLGRARDLVEVHTWCEVLGSLAVVHSRLEADGETYKRKRERERMIVLDVDPRGSTVAPIRASGNACRKA